MKIRYLFLYLIANLLLFSCVDGNYDPEGRWEINAATADDCEDNDTFETAFQASQADLLYLNFYDDIKDYYVYSFGSDKTYTIKADVPINHLSDTSVSIYTYGADPQLVEMSTAPADDDHDAVIESFTPTASSYYILVTNSISSGTGELRGYMLTINEEE